MTGSRRWALAGLAAAVAGLGLAELVAAVLAPTSGPITAVAAATVDLVPPWLKDAAIRAFGTWDKTVLVAGVVLTVAALAAGCGVAARGRLRAAQSGVLAVAAVAAVAALTRADAPVLAALPALAGGLAGAWLLEVLTAALRAPDPGSPTPTTPPADRFARRTLLAATAGLLAAGAATVLAGPARGVEAARRALRLPAPPAPAQLPAGVEVAVAGVAPFRTPTADFYRIDTAITVPRVDHQDWRLRIHGLVEREVTVTYQDLLAGPVVERDITLCCVSNEVGGDLIGNARWLGVPLAPLLRRAGPTAQADMVLSRSADGWTASTPLPVLLDGRDALLAIGMNGEPLPQRHGFPVRMVVPGLYGYVSATKWVVDLLVTRFDRDQAYWTSRGWSPRGPVKTQSRIDVPRADAEVAAGTVAVAGVAWAQHRGVGKVEVSVDGGPWQPARLAAAAGIDTWRQWVYPWNATAGRHTLRVRATDATGAVQAEQPAPPAPDGATGLHAVEVRVT